MTIAESSWAKLPSLTKKKRPPKHAARNNKPTNAVNADVQAKAQGSPQQLPQLPTTLSPDVQPNQLASPSQPGSQPDSQNHQKSPGSAPADAAAPPAQPGTLTHEEWEALRAEIAATQDAIPITKEVHELLMRSSPAYFAKYMLTGPVEYGGKFIIAAHHEEWDKIVVRHKRACIIAPRDHGKSVFFTFAYCIWRLFYQPKIKGVIFSATQPQAIRILDAIKDEIETNPKLQWLQPARKRNWSRQMIRCSNGAVLRAHGFGTRVRGDHPDFAVVDDGLNDESMYSEIARKRQSDFFFSTLTNMVVPTGSIFVVGTPFHQLDLYGELEQNKNYHFQRFPAISPETKLCLWPQRYNLELLRSRETEIGSIRFSREFLCQAVSDAMSIFPSTLFLGEPIEQPMLKLGMPLEFWARIGITIFQGIDIAISTSVKADWFVIWTVGVDAKGNRWIVDIQRHQGMPFFRQKSLILELGRLYQPALIGIESNQMQAVWANELIRTTDLPIKKILTDKSKNSLEHGVPSLRTLLENNKYRTPLGDKRSMELIKIWRNEMQAFTYVDGKLQGLGEHDDTVMACYICERTIRLGASSYAFGNDTDIAQADIMDELTGTGKYEIGANIAPPANVADGEVDPRTIIPVDDNQRESFALEPSEPLDGFGFPLPPNPQGPSPMEDFGLP